MKVNVECTGCEITVEEVDFYIERKRKNVRFIDFIVGRLFGFFIAIIRTKGNSLKQIQGKLDEISRLNKSLIQLISNK